MATSMGLGQFAKRMQVVAKLFGEDAEKTVRRAAVAADTTAVVTTPIDTGRARANWIASVDRPVEVVKDAPGSPPAGEAEALAQGRVAIGSFKLGNTSIFLTNSLPYIVPLDQGSSRQAPSGMSNQAIEAARRQLQRAKLLRRR